MSYIMSLVASFGNSVYAYIPPTRSQALWRTEAGFNSHFFFFLSVQLRPISWVLSGVQGGAGSAADSGCSTNGSITWAFYDLTIEALIKSHSTHTQALGAVLCCVLQRTTFPFDLAASLLLGPGRDWMFGHGPSSGHVIWQFVFLTSILPGT